MEHRPDPGSPTAEYLTDPSDPRVADYVCLTDVELRTRFEPPRGVFIAEGQLVIRRAIRAGYRLRSVLVSPRWLNSIAELDLPPGTPTYVAPRDLLRAITGFDVHRGALASVHRPDLPTPALLRGQAHRMLALEGVNTHTNVGAIFRSAAALGMDAVLLSPSCADPLYRRAVRVSMGEVFVVPYARALTWPGELAQLREAGFRVLALTPDPAATPLDELCLSPTDRTVLVLGAEGAGLSPATRAVAEESVRIPMSRGVDSLNVAAAAAIGCYVVGRRSPSDGA